MEKLMGDTAASATLMNIKDDMDAYRAAMKRIVSGDTSMQVKMLGSKKFFSCPWLVCPDQLVGNLN